MVTPVELPDLRFLQESSFDIMRFQVGDGAAQIADLQDPEWQAEYSFAGFPTRQDRDIWQGFLRKLEGKTTPVLAFDPARRVPRYYYDEAGRPLSSGSPWGAPVLADYNRAQSTFDLTGFAPSQQLYSGDYISFQDVAGLWHLHALTEDVQTDGSGAATVVVTPRPALGLVHGGADVRMRDACCMMVLEWRNDAFRFGASNGAPFSVSGRQIFKAFI